jgi:hypothetical protein
LRPDGATSDSTPAGLPPDWYEHYLERLSIMTEDGSPVTAEVEAVALADTLDAMRRDGAALGRPARGRPW